MKDPTKYLESYPSTDTRERDVLKIEIYSHFCTKKKGLNAFLALFRRVEKKEKTAPSVR